MSESPPGNGRAGQAIRLARPAPLRVLAALPAILALVAVAATIAGRVTVPFALEWQEPAMVEHVLRVQRGAALYVEPTMDFAPFPYPPLFYWLGALGADMGGGALFALRLLSVLGLAAVLGSMLVSFRWMAGIVAAGWFASTYGWTGFWFDVARVDTLALGLGAVSWALVLRVERQPASSGVAASAAAAGFSVLAVLTKQTQLGLAVGLAVALLVGARTRRAGLVYSGVLVGGLVAVVLWLEAQSAGRFLWTTVDLLRGSPFHGPAIWGFWVESFGVLALPVALATLARLAGGRSGWTPALVVGAAALVATGWAGRAHEGGFDNTLLPVALASAFACGGPLRWLLGTGGEPSPGDAVPSMRWPWGAAVVTAAATLLVFQDPRPAIPTAEDRAAYDSAAVRIAELTERGDVWQPISAVPTDEPGFVHKMAIVDLAKSREVEAAAKLLAELRSTIAERRFAAIVVDALPRDGWGDLAPLIEAHYDVAERIGAAPGAASGTGARVRAAGTPVTGAPLKPRWILLPRSR